MLLHEILNYIINLIFCGKKYANRVHHVSHLYFRYGSHLKYLHSAINLYKGDYRFMTLNQLNYKHATGNIPFNMTNDYMFRVVLQKNEYVLKGLICSLLHLNHEDVQSTQITNPIELGEDIDDKTFVLDIDVILNNSSLINLEMQMTNEHNWTERSLSYLCRSFDQLYQGETYASAKPAIHIGFLNFHPFPEYPEFYATYKLINEKNGMVYSDKFSLSVIDLKHIELSTDEDKESLVDAWAKFFIATSWEEVIMIAEHIPHLEAAAQTLYEANADEATKRKCRARRDYYKQVNTREKMLHELTAEISSLEHEIAQRQSLLAEKEVALAEKDSALAEKDSQIADLTERIKQLEQQIKQ